MLQTNKMIFFFQYHVGLDNQSIKDSQLNLM